MEVYDLTHFCIMAAMHFDISTYNIKTLLNNLLCMYIPPGEDC